MTRLGQVETLNREADLTVCGEAGTARETMDAISRLKPAVPGLSTAKSPAPVSAANLKSPPAPVGAPRPPATRTAEELLE